jgi:hypothetical protein
LGVAGDFVAVDVFGYFAAEAGQYGWGAGKLPDDVGEERGGCVAAGEQDVEEFGADDGKVLGRG